MACRLHREGSVSARRGRGGKDVTKVYAKLASILVSLGLTSMLVGCVEFGTGEGDDSDLDGSGPSLSGGLGIDSEGNVEGHVEADLGFLQTATAETDEASRDLAAVADVRLLGYRASPDFHRGRPIEVSLLPLDAQGRGIIDVNVYVGLSVRCEVGFGMSGSVDILDTYAPDRTRPFQFGIGIDGSGSMTTTVSVHAPA